MPKSPFAVAARMLSAVITHIFIIHSLIGRCAPRIDEGHAHDEDEMSRRFGTSPRAPTYLLACPCGRQENPDRWHVAGDELRIVGIGYKEDFASVWRKSQRVYPIFAGRTYGCISAIR